MGAIDEEEWEREGLFTTVDELCNIKVGGCSLNETLRPSAKPLVFLLHLVYQTTLCLMLWLQWGFVLEPTDFLVCVVRGLRVMVV
jgi:hypothetical protein